MSAPPKGSSKHPTCSESLSTLGHTTSDQALRIVYRCRGQEVLIRPLQIPADQQRLHDYFLRLSRDSAYCRFFVLGGAPPPTPIRGSQASHEGEVALVAVTTGPGQDEIIIGEACYVVDPACDCQGEVAVSVADEYQAHGLGTALLRALIDVARSRKLERLIVYVLAQNYPALRTFLGLGFKTVLWQPGVLKMVLELSEWVESEKTRQVSQSPVQFASPPSLTGSLQSMIGKEAMSAASAQVDNSQPPGAKPIK